MREPAFRSTAKLFHHFRRVRRYDGAIFAVETRLTRQARELVFSDYDILVGNNCAKRLHVPKVVLLYRSVMLSFQPKSEFTFDTVGRRVAHDVPRMSFENVANRNAGDFSLGDPSLDFIDFVYHQHGVLYVAPHRLFFARIPRTAFFHDLPKAIHSLRELPNSCCPDVWASADQLPRLKASVFVV